MTKKQLIKRLSEKTGYDPAAIAEVVNALPMVIFETLKAGGEVKWRGFGTFMPVKRAGRNFTVPKKNGGLHGVVEKEARLTVKFNVSDSVKEGLNK